MSVVLKGKKTLYDDDGREYGVMLQSVRGSDKGFTKVWLADFMAKLDLIGNQKLKVAFWLIDNAERNTNYINYSLRQIAEKSGLGLSTVVRTMHALQEADFIRKVNKVYMLNPAILYKNYSAQARQGVLTEYLTEGEIDKDLSPEEQIENLSKAISALEKRKREKMKEIGYMKNEQAKMFAEMEDVKLGIDRKKDLAEKAEEAGALAFYPDNTPQRCEEDKHDIK